MAFSGLALQTYKGPGNLEWANTIRDNFNFLITGVAKAWVNFDSSNADISASIRGSENISTLVDGGVGLYQVTLTTGMTSGSGYVVLGAGRTSTATQAGIIIVAVDVSAGGLQSGGFFVESRHEDNINRDSNPLMITVFGDKK